MSATRAAGPTNLPWILAGPAHSSGPESLAGHVDRLGPRPAGGAATIVALAESGLRGRGGGHFPAARKWEAVKHASRGHAVVLVNGAEGEPASRKDRTLMSLRPHLVLDGALIAAEAIGASEVILYIGRPFSHANAALHTALKERRRARDLSMPIRVVAAPHRYVAGEETAAVHRVNGGEAKPTSIPPRPFQRGVKGRPTLVQNVETLAFSALIARFGSSWFRSRGTKSAPGAMLVTVSGHGVRDGVYEVELGIGLGNVVRMAEGEIERTSALLVGGYFGSWVSGDAAESLFLDAKALADDGIRLGCGVIYVLPPGACGVAETARILRFLANESAGQCGPCIYGLEALATVVAQIAAGRARALDHVSVRRWADQLAHGRGACRHPDGAVGLLQSAMNVFAADFERHRTGPCSGTRMNAGLPIPHPSNEWR
ncbi:MAG: NADH-ubiquinone oxidoreductase-F iron-sulfur binding region domain-containing protein [Candidatus Dormibacteraceae bacterium]